MMPSAPWGIYGERPFPLWSAAAGGTSSVRSEVPPRILLVEDEFLTAALLGDELAAAGYAIVGPYGTLASATAAADGEPFL